MADPCWWHIFLDEACPNEATWRDGNPPTHFMGWCDEHRHSNDVPLEAPKPAGEA